MAIATDIAVAVHIYIYIYYCAPVHLNAQTKVELDRIVDICVKRI